MRRKEVHELMIKIRVTENTVSGRGSFSHIPTEAACNFIIGSGTSSDPVLVSPYGWSEIINTLPYCDFK